MSQIPANIEIELDNDKLYRNKGLASTPTQQIRRDFISVGDLKQYVSARSSWDNIELTFVEDFKDENFKEILSWYEAHILGDRMPKKRKIRFHTRIGTCILEGAFPISYEIRTDAFHSFEPILINSEKIKRKVLFEKIGNEFFKIQLNLTVEVDNVVINRIEGT